MFVASTNNDQSDLADIPNSRIGIVKDKLT